MKKNLLILASGIFLVCISIIFSTSSVFAQSANTSLNLTVFPATIDIVANPGSSVEQKIRVRNNTSNSLNLGIQTSKLTTDTNGNVIPTESKDEYLSWISYAPSSFTARPNEWTDVTVQIKIPPTAAFGYYYAVRITPTAQVQKQANGSAIIGQAVIPLLLNVKQSGAIANIQLVSFTPTQPFYEYLPATFAVTFMNRGNIHIRPQGNVFVQRGSTGDIAILAFNEGNGAMLPGQKRTYTAIWDDGFMVQEPVIVDGTVKRDTNGNPVSQLVIHWDKLTSFRFGKYSAHLLAVYNDGTRDVPIEATVSFWVFPWKIVLGIVVGCLILAVVIKFWLTWYVARAIKKSKSS